MAEIVIKRNNSLDALRGLAILLMVLSSSISFGILPGWMYHAQVPPPAHVFKPEIPGITWVDLVFPFFLFSMGAAIPLSMRKNLFNNSSFKTAFEIFKRFLLLAFFAFFTLHTRAWVLSDNPGPKDHLLSILSFVVLFLIYTDTKNLFDGKKEWIVRVSGFIIAALILTFGFSGTKSFSIQQTDVIILVLANMALFGMFIWWGTSNNAVFRLGLLPFIAAVFLASGEAGSINQAIFNYTPFPWLYKFYYLKYLFIILVATLAGEWILTDKDSDQQQEKQFSKKYVLLGIAGFALIVSNVTGLFLRTLQVNFVLSALLLGFMLYVSHEIKRVSRQNLIVKFTQAGAYLLMLGLFLEAYEGGIKKDYSTYSYYFVCTGLAFIAMTIFCIVERLSVFTGMFKLFSLTGKNPMIAYTAGNLLLIPLLNLTGTLAWLDKLGESYAGGFLRGVIFTSVVALITILATKRKIFWKT